MSKDKELYAFQVAQIRVRETQLLGQVQLESLLSMESYEACMQFLSEKGWAVTDDMSMEQMLAAEQERCWDMICHMCNAQQLHYFDLFTCKRDFHNLKSAIKEAYIQEETEGVYAAEGTIPVEKLKFAAAENEFASLPGYLKGPGAEARAVLFATGDSQLADTIIDKAALEEMARLGKASENSLLAEYSQFICASSDIRIAVRAVRAGKDSAFLGRALAACDTLSVTGLEAAARGGMDALLEYLEHGSYPDCVPAIKAGGSAFDTWCDNRIIELIKPQKYNPFTISPLIAYFIAKTMEVQSVRIILSGKLNKLPEEKIMERVRESYV